ncbi:MAG: hypothetical protein KBE09_02095 [Candidatus Pacebacteria bacterium]|nr:hypothetical protein [Candidatus Paceibacterota bacterium]
MERRENIAGFFLWVACAAVFACVIPQITSAEVLLEEQRARLEAELASIEADIDAKRGVLKEKQAQRTTLERDIAILNTQVEKAQLSIKHRDLTIRKIKGDIDDKVSAINVLDDKMSRSRQSLSQLIRRTNEIDDTSFAELALSGSISDIFEDIDTFALLQNSLGASFDEITTIREDLSVRKKTLEEKQEEELEMKQLQVLEKNKVEASKKQVGAILTATKGQEKTYQKLISEREKTAAEIRATLFSLRDSSAISFGDAYRYAKEAGDIIGVRPALVLGVLRQETNLGENVGQCLLTNEPNKGDGKGKNTGKLFKGVMKATRDVDPYMDITSELGIDPYSQVVSCPPGYGYGGAMGPAQFIPSTWVLYKDRLSRATGNNPPNPWDARTAIFATAMLMADNGADKGTRASERLAALRYFAGWGNANKAAYAFYGDDVMEFADQFQRQIDVLEGK